MSGPVAISYSGGTSSEWLVEATIRGVLPREPKMAVFFADTGGEHKWTYRHVAEVESRCRGAGLPFFRVRKPGPTLAEHIIGGGVPVKRDPTKRRMDQPPFFVDKNGTRGRVPQRCSREFKRAVLRRAQRQWLRDHNYRNPTVNTWIGFAADEAHRATKAIAKMDVAWERMNFPALRLGVARYEQRKDLIK